MLDEVNRALKLYGMNPLYAKDKRDACFIVAINNRKYELFEIDDMLERQGLKKYQKKNKQNPHRFGGDFLLNSMIGFSYRYLKTYAE